MSATPGWIDARQFDVIDIMAEVSRSVSANVDMVISTITVQRKSIFLQGTTGSYKDVDRIKAGLASSGQFKHIAISSANFKRTDKRVVFSLVIARRQVGET